MYKQGRVNNTCFKNEVMKQYESKTNETERHRLLLREYRTLRNYLKSISLVYYKRIELSNLWHPKRERKSKFSHIFCHIRWKIVFKENRNWEKFKAKVNCINAILRYSLTARLVLMAPINDSEKVIFSSEKYFLENNDVCPIQEMFSVIFSGKLNK